jgi:hypothetical protein
MSIYYSLNMKDSFALFIPSLNLQAAGPNLFKIFMYPTYHSYMHVNILSTEWVIKYNSFVNFA